MRRIFLCIALAARLSVAGGNIGRAESLYERTDYAGAARLLNDSSKDPTELRLLGQCRFMMDDPKSAADVLERAAALAPNDAMIQLWLGRALGRRAEQASPARGVFLVSKVRNAFEKAVKLDPNPDAVNDLFDFYMNAPSLLGGGIEKARGLLPVLDKIDPAEAWHARARLDEEKKDFKAVEADLRRAVEIAPNDAGQIMNLARFLARRSRYAESDELCDRAARIAPGAPGIMYARAELWLQSNRRQSEARALLKQYVASDKLKPGDPPRADAAKLLAKAGGA